MALMTAQPLKANPRRLREHGLVEAKLSWEQIDQELRDDGIVAGIALTGERSRQFLLLSDEDLSFLIPTLIAQASPRERARILKAALLLLDPSTVFRTLSAYFSREARQRSRG